MVVIEGFSHANMDERGTESESANTSDDAEICYATGDFTALEDNQVRISVRCMPVAGLSGGKTFGLYNLAVLTRQSKTLGKLQQLELWFGYVEVLAG